MTLFKYLPKKYLEAFFIRGSVRIGTLYEYRKTEQYGEVVGDQDEGFEHTEMTFASGAQVDLSENSAEADFVRQHILRPDQQHASLKIDFEKGAGFIVQSSSPDFHIYCTTTEYDLAVMKQFGCDSCMEIVDPQAFFRAISRRVRHRSRFEVAASVHYMNKTTHYKKPHQVPGVLMKDEAYWYQNEFRTVWRPARTKCEPILIDVPRAIRYCRVHAP